MAEIVCVRVKPTKNTVLAELSVFDQLKLIFSHFINRDSQELDANKTVSLTELKEKSEFITILDRAIAKLEKHDSVTLLVSSKYQFYLKQVLDDESGLGQYYNFDAVIPDIPIAVKHTFRLRISKKTKATEVKHEEE